MLTFLKSFKKIGFKQKNISQKDNFKIAFCDL